MTGLSLLGQIAAHLREHGLSDLSQRPRADALTTSGRILIFCFGAEDAGRR